MNDTTIASISNDASIRELISARASQPYTIEILQFKKQSAFVMQKLEKQVLIVLEGKVELIMRHATKQLLNEGDSATIEPGNACFLCQALTQNYYALTSGSMEMLQFTII